MHRLTDPELGGARFFERLVEALRDVLIIVDNLVGFLLELLPFGASRFTAGVLRVRRPRPFGWPSRSVSGFWLFLRLHGLSRQAGCARRHEEAKGHDNNLG